MSAWIDQIFDREQCRVGNSVRRARRDVEKYASVEELTDAVKARNYHLVEVGEQLIVLCNEGDLRVLL
jgi:hypothetical protein